VFWEPAVSDRPVVESRRALEAWLRRLRKNQPALNVSVTEPTEHGDGAVLEAIVTRGADPQEVWRVALAVCVKDDLICQVRAFWSRDAAEDWVTKFR
jgi:hypothetical protein